MDYQLSVVVAIPWDDHSAVARLDLAAPPRVVRGRVASGDMPPIDMTNTTRDTLLPETCGVDGPSMGP